MKNLVDNPKPPFRLYREINGKFENIINKNGDEIFACGECGAIHGPYVGNDAHERAAKCCKQHYCECGEKIAYFMSMSKCSKCNSLEGNKKILSNATEIQEWEGPVYDDNSSRYYENMEEFEDWRYCLDDNESVPEWLFPCEEIKFGRLDAHDVIESRLCEMHEDAECDDVEGLQKFLDEWCDKQSIASWEPDFSRKIKVKEQG